MSLRKKNKKKVIGGEKSSINIVQNTMKKDFFQNHTWCYLSLYEIVVQMVLNQELWESKKCMDILKERLNEMDGQWYNNIRKSIYLIYEYKISPKKHKFILDKKFYRIERNTTLSLFCTREYGNVQILEYILRNNFLHVNYKYCYNEKTILYSSLSEFINQIDRYCYDALMFAIQDKMFSSVKLLIHYGAKVNSVHIKMASKEKNYFESILNLLLQQYVEK